MYRKTTFIVVIFGLVFLSFEGNAQELTDVLSSQSPVVKGQGNSVTANMSGINALFANPANFVIPERFGGKNKIGVYMGLRMWGSSTLLLNLFDKGGGTRSDVLNFFAQGLFLIKNFSGISSVIKQAGESVEHAKKAGMALNIISTTVGSLSKYSLGGSALMGYVNHGVGIGLRGTVNTINTSSDLLSILIQYDFVGGYAHSFYADDWVINFGVDVRPFMRYYITFPKTGFSNDVYVSMVGKEREFSKEKEDLASTKKELEKKADDLDSKKKAGQTVSTQEQDQLKADQAELEEKAKELQKKSANLKNKSIDVFSNYIRKINISPFYAGWGVAVDAGLTASYHGLTLGVQARDIYTPVFYKKTVYMRGLNDFIHQYGFAFKLTNGQQVDPSPVIIPATISLGMMYDIPIAREDLFDFRFHVQFADPFNLTKHFRGQDHLYNFFQVLDTGAEVTLLSFLTLYGGLSDGLLSFGVGADLFFMELHAAIYNYPIGLPTSGTAEQIKFALETSISF